MPRISTRIFDAVVAYLSGGSFSSALTPPNAMARTTLAEVGNELSIDYTVPAPLCRNSSGGSPQFAVSAMLALLDDFSSYALMMQDRNHRPGVSVTLKTEIIRPCKAGDTVKLVSRCDKIGKSVAFLSMELRSAFGDVLARGKHIKYVKMGFFWDLLTSAVLFPLVLAILEYTVKRKAPKAKNTAGSDSAADAKSQAEHGGLFKCLNIAAVADPTSLFASDEEAATEGKKGKKYKKTTPVIDAKEKCFTFKVSKATSNVLGAMHGGAVAAAAEEACVQLAAADPSKKGCFVDSIEVAYISPAKVSCLVCDHTHYIVRACVCCVAATFVIMLLIHCTDNEFQGELVIVLREDEHSTHRRATLGRVLSRRTGQVCSEFTCGWSAKK
jgi:acyl-coenzyme A thioesterase PaaI-like protein